ncbi:unnamed protein product [Ectocarpus sp. 12 AP-2014]
MANHSFLLRQWWCTCRLLLGIPCLKHLPVPSLYFSQLSHVHFSLPQVQRTFCNYTNPVFALGAGFTVELASSSSTLPYFCLLSRRPLFPVVNLSPCLRWSMQVPLEPHSSFNNPYTSPPSLSLFVFLDHFLSRQKQQISCS